VTTTGAYDSGEITNILCSSTNADTILVVVTNEDGDTVYNGSAGTLTGATFVGSDGDLTATCYVSNTDNASTVSCNVAVPGVSRCGDTIVDGAFGEICDDGNTSDNDTCLNTCQANVCGDGIP
jgi:cysteine-rich repeat protein